MRMTLKSLLLLLIGALLLTDCLYLVTVNVTHLGVILPAAIGLALVALALSGGHWQIWLARKRWRVLAWRIILVGFFMWLATLLIYFMSLHALVGAPGKPFEPRVIIVLGSSTPDGQASPTLVERLKLSATMAKQHPSATVVVSGGPDFGQKIAEARVMADYLTGLGLNANRIMLEDRSTSTHENLLFSARLLEPLGIQRDQSMLLVTSDFHTARASRIAQKAGWTNVQTAGAPTPQYLRYNAWMREYFANLSGWLLGEY